MGGGAPGGGAKRKSAPRVPKTLATPLYLAARVPNVLPQRDEGSGKPCAVIEAL